MPSTNFAKLLFTLEIIVTVCYYYTYRKVIALETVILQPTDVEIMRCASLLKAGELVAFPTETVYALGASATNPTAVEKIFDVKKRPKDKPLIVAVAKKSDIPAIVKSIPQKAQILIDKFMPGALTLVFDRASVIPDIVTAGTETVAVRIPDNKIAKKLIELAHTPIVVPSANTADKPSPTLASHVKDDLDGKIGFIIDGGQSKIGIESTIVDTRTEPPVILRAGGVTIEQIEKAIGHVVSKREEVKAPGAYVPTAEVRFSAYYDGMAQNIRERYDELDGKGQKTLIICLDGNKREYGTRNIVTVGKNFNEYAHNLFAALRGADAEHYDVVLAEGVDPAGIGESLISRLIKLSGGMII